jgi:glutamyl-tRNA synthetase
MTRGPSFRQSVSAAIRTVIDDLLDKGLAYRCDCPKDRLDRLRDTQMAAKVKPRYDGHCRGARSIPISRT